MQFAGEKKEENKAADVRHWKCDASTGTAEVRAGAPAAHTSSFPPKLAESLKFCGRLCRGIIKTSGSITTSIGLKHAADEYV